MCSKWKKEKTPAGSSVSSQKLLWPLVFLPNEGCKHGWKMLQKDIILLLCSLLLQRTENWWSFRERHDLDAQPHPIWRTRNQTTLSWQVFCCWHVIRKAIWRNLEVRNLKILPNICLFSSSCLCPLVCLNFVRWKKIKIKYYVIFWDF